MPVRPSRGAKEARPTTRRGSAAAGLRFLEFAIRAWREGKSLHVLAHSTPVGGMRQPVVIPLPKFDSESFRLPMDATLSQAAHVGRQLAGMLLPSTVWAMLGSSLRSIADDPALGIRLRLCLAEEMIDLPWEYLYRPDVDAPEARNGFLLMDERVSLVREPPTLATRSGVVKDKQRCIFVGATFDDGNDHWSVEAECLSLTRSLNGLRDVIEIESAFGNDSERIDALLDAGCDFFHYGGHVDITDDQAQLVRVASLTAMTQSASNSLHRKAEASPPAAASWSNVDVLAHRLKGAGTRFVMLNACNSGYWPVARHFIHAGVACMVGVQGEVSSIAALHFSEKVYQSLALGLSLDEAVTWARLHVMDHAPSDCPTDWGRFMVYMPAESGVLFPVPTGSSLEPRQRHAREERRKTVAEFKSRTESLDGPSIQSVLSEIAARSVLVLGRFTDERKAVLQQIRGLLSRLGNAYVPIVFDFEKSKDRDLIESIVRFAAVSRFVIADLSDPKSVPAELQAIVPQFPSLPIVPIIESTQREYPVSDHVLRRQSVCKVVRYRDPAHLDEIFDEQVVAAAEKLHRLIKPPLLM